MNDEIRSPDHYTGGTIEVWDFITHFHLDFLVGNVIKYLCRAGKKEGQPYTKDLSKAVAYLRKAYNEEPDVPTEEAIEKQAIVIAAFLQEQALNELVSGAFIDALGGNFEEAIVGLQAEIEQCERANLSLDTLAGYEAACERIYEEEES